MGRLFCNGLFNCHWRHLLKDGLGGRGRFGRVGQLLLQSLLDLLGQIVVVCLGYLQNGGQEGPGGGGGGLGALRCGLAGGGSPLLGRARGGEQVQYMGSLAALGIFLTCGHECGSFP